jgi:dTDP-4-amino-4,6-dideoxygalactose transaminase
LTHPIPFNRPSFPGASLDAFREAVAAAHYSGDGHFTKACHQSLEQSLGVPKALLTTSCTHALEMCALLLDLAPGDEVIVPSFTFVSSVNAFVLRGVKPVFADIRPDTLNIDEQRLPALITPRTRAIVVVHYAGVGCEMDEINALAAAHGITVIEDNAHGLFGRYRGRWLGTLGALATQSFHETKNFSCGEGGALLLNDARFIERSEILREKGTNRARFFRGQVDKYTWVDLGSSYLPSELLAALLAPQLAGWREIQDARRRLWDRYAQGVGDWAFANDVRLPVIPGHCEQAYHMFYMLLPNLEVRQAFIAHLRSRGVNPTFHYQPLDRAPMAARFAPQTDACPVTSEIADRLVRLPFYNTLADDDQDRVMNAVQEFSV